MNTKKFIRKETTKRLRDQDAVLREERSLIIQKKLLSSEEFKVARAIMAYVSLPTEVSTSYFNEQAMKQGKRVAVPYIGTEIDTIIASELTTIECLEKGPLGIYQPKNGNANIIPTKEIDLVIVPAIAYDKKNMRLGRGKGYYDRFLASEDLSHAKIIGLAFNFQVLESIPSDLHDRPVTRVITD